MASRAVRLAAGCLLVGLVAAGAVLVRPATTLEAVRTVADDPVLFLALVVGLYLVRPLFLWPTTPLALVVGYGLGVPAGVAVALCGVLVTVTPVFLVVRWLGAGAEGGRIRQTISRYFEATGPVRGVTAARLAPIPSDVTTAAAALSGIRYRHLLAGTAVGELPWILAAVIVGATADTLVTDGLGEVGLTLGVVFTVAALALVSGPLYRLHLTVGERSGPERS